MYAIEISLVSDNNINNNATLMLYGEIIIENLLIDRGGRFVER